MDSNCLLVTSFEFSKHYIRSFLQILYHSITTKVVAIDIQSFEAVIQEVFLYHCLYHSCKRLRDATIVLQTRVFSFVIKKR